VLGEDGRIVAFVVRLAKTIASDGARTLVPRTALRLEPGPIFHLAWTEDQLRAQPRLDADFQPHNRVDGGAPVESQWMPARPTVVPPGQGMNATEAAIEGASGGISGAALGAAAGFAIGGPVGAASLAVFFAAGGSLAGILSGASHETAAEAGELKLDTVSPEQEISRHGPLLELERRLADPAIGASGLVTMTRFAPLTTTHGAPESPVDEGPRRAGGLTAA
jgi:hypothetical protein